MDGKATYVYISALNWLGNSARFLKKSTIGEIADGPTIKKPGSSLYS
jgi:hypothetical protein